MAHVEDFVANMNIRSFAGTPDGIHLLENSQDLQRAVVAFARAEDCRVFDGEEQIGQGSQSRVFAFAGDLAVKVSTRATNTAESGPESSRHVANLVNQFTYMTALGEALNTQPDAGIRAPEQLFAFNTELGNSLLVQKHIKDVTTLQAWEKQRGPAGLIEQRRLHGAVYSRVDAAIGKDHPLRQGLGELSELMTRGYISVNRGDIVNAGNVLVPAGTTQPETETLHVIDLPGLDYTGAQAARKARSYLRSLIPATAGRFGFRRHKQEDALVRYYGK